MTVSWPVGQIAEIADGGVIGPDWITCLRVGPSGEAVIHEDHWVSLDGVWVIKDRHVTAVRPLRLVPQDAVVLPERAAREIAWRNLAGTYRGSLSFLLGAVADAVEAAETPAVPTPAPETPATPCSCGSVQLRAVLGVLRAKLCPEPADPSLRTLDGPVQRSMLRGALDEAVRLLAAGER